MKQNFLILFLICSISLFNGGVVSAEKYLGQGKDKTSTSASGSTGTKSLLAGCNAPTSATYMEINNVKALIFTGGDMFWDIFGTQDARYEIPKGSGIHSMFLASLWLGGTDVSGQLRIAAQRYASAGNRDFWSGPLNTTTAEITPDVCSEWDKHFVITRAEVEAHNAWCLAPDEFPDYTIPKSILEWPAHGDISKGQAYFLAPFFDQNGDGFYDPYDCDYPYYDLSADVFCDRGRDRVPKLFGDETFWYVFNDKGNVHTETGGDAIGLEVHAQFFAFATNDEINNMTFSNYIVINRSTFKLVDTYFGTNFDADMGCYQDDYTGCDVKRGLGYIYNGDAFDEDCAGSKGYGTPIPAIGVDFFEGPYMDTRVDSPTVDRPDGGCDASINGLNFGDDIADNERWGMRRFVYYCNPGINCNYPLDDPQTAVDYYNYLKGYWKDGTRMVYGGNGHVSTCPLCEYADFMFPGAQNFPNQTDLCNWGVCSDPDPVLNDMGFGIGCGLAPLNSSPWTEKNEGNPVGDRRFVHSAGPFTLEPGATNDITVGLVWAKSNSSDPFESVELIRLADDKAQALFDNCFKILNGPDAPKITCQEMDKEIILYLSNPLSSNNNMEKPEDYEERDPTLIPCSDSAIGAFDNFYRFQGYQIYQLKDATVSISDIGDINMARLVAQVDIKDNVDKLVNFIFDEEIGYDVPTLMVNGENKGIKHSFKVTKDLFAIEDPQLVNHKTYYFMAIAYAYNQFNCYNAADPDNPAYNGNKKPYLAGRKDGFGRSIEAIACIPHKPEVENFGTEINSKYGDSPLITRIEGQGSGGLIIDLTQASVDGILSGPPWKVVNPVYQRAKAPVGVKIIDPLNVRGGDFAIYFDGITGSSSWMLVDESDNTLAQNLHWQPNIIDIADDTSSALSKDSVVGERYIIKSDNYIYEWDGNKWAGTLPIPGYAAWKDGNKEFYVYDGTAWRLLENAWHSEQSLKVPNEQIFPDIGISITIEQLVGSSPWRNGSPPTFGNRIYPGPLLNVETAIEPHLVFDYPIPDTTKNPDPNNGFIEATMTFADNDKRWLSGIADGDASDALNWIRSGDANDPLDYKGFDDNEIYENILGGFWAPYRMCSTDSFGLALGSKYNGYGHRNKNVIHNITGVDLVITSDKSKWTRSVVLEMEEDTLFAEGNVPKFSIRSHASVDKNGDSDGTGTTGMGWFPGYAINVETGERLNIILGEGSDNINGNDMIWNPTSDLTSPLGQMGLDNNFGCVGCIPSPGNPSSPFWAGGKHYIYIVGYNHHETTIPNDGYVYGSIYDEGAYIRMMLDTTDNNTLWKVFKDIIWAGMPLLEKDYKLIHPDSSGNSETDVTILSDENDASYDVTIRLRVKRPYEKYAVGTSIFNPGLLEIGETYYVNKGPVVHNSVTYNLGEVFVAVNSSFSIHPNSDSTDILPSTLPVSVIKTVNAANPLYKFSLDEYATRTSVSSIAENVLELINVVPNPYNAFSAYERSQLDNRIKIINLPQKCTVSIYNVSGTLIRRFERDDPTITSIDWDLKNSSNVPIAGGVYLIHVNAPGIGERVLKWFGALRPVDLDAF